MFVMCESVYIASGNCGEPTTDICNGGDMGSVDFDNGFGEVYNWKDLEACSFVAAEAKDDGDRSGKGKKGNGEEFEGDQVSQVVQVTKGAQVSQGAQEGKGGGPRSEAIASSQARGRRRRCACWDGRPRRPGCNQDGPAIEHRDGLHSATNGGVIWSMPCRYKYFFLSLLSDKMQIVSLYWL